MRFIPTKMHAVLDYVLGVVLIAVPLFWLDDPAVPRAAIWAPVVVGALMLVQSLMTDYELGLARVVSVPAHLTVDAISGVFLAASPWLFGFADYVWAPHLIVGLMEIGAALTTELHRRELPEHRDLSRGHPA